MGLPALPAWPPLLLLLFVIAAQTCWHVGLSLLLALLVLQVGLSQEVVPAPAPAAVSTSRRVGPADVLVSLVQETDADASVAPEALLLSLLLLCHVSHSISSSAATDWSLMLEPDPPAPVSCAADVRSCWYAAWKCLCRLSAAWCATSGPP
jgi:hypothetical protein